MNDKSIENFRVEVSLPEIGRDILNNIKISDNYRLCITEVLIDIKDNFDRVNEQWIKIRDCTFVNGYGNYDKILTRKVRLPLNTVNEIKNDILQGVIQDNQIKITSLRGAIKKIIIIIVKDGDKNENNK